MSKIFNFDLWKPQPRYGLKPLNLVQLAWALIFVPFWENYSCKHSMVRNSKCSISRYRPAYAVSLLITALLKIVFIFQAIPLIWWHHLDPYPSTIWWHFSSSLGWRSNMSSYRAIVRNLSQRVLTHFGSRIWQVPFSHQFYIHLKIHGFPGVQLDFDGIPWVHLELNGFKGTCWTYANECPVLS